MLKSGHFFCSRELPRNIDAYVLRDSSAPLRVLLWKAGVFGFPFGMLLVLAAGGAVLNAELLVKQGFVDKYQESETRSLMP